eukprot:TRINITY_DN8385_c0_g1_i1.p1 TRINITY_DN8385_c0_g1~~TRINITY_DN8385_c0_g1_i1.p1  ORF type:complete len:607 (+),score=204.82 TRINITY_DN8385_c0_g1_i1:269-2089(+)
MYDSIDKLYNRNIQHAREGVNTKFEDEDQMQAQDEIFEMLLAAGYFRARISTLQPFDKILGGLAWCITSSNVDVDVDVFFSDDAPLGEKIDVGERICKALVQMRCPHTLSSPQIRGLDFLKIFPVVQWLVKKVYEVREETAELIRLFTESQFAKVFSHPEDITFKEKLPKVREYYGQVNDNFKPRRRFKRSENENTSDESKLVTNTLLEYGHHTKESKSEHKNNKNNKKNEGEDDELGEKFKNEYAAFNSSGSVSGSLVGSMIGLRSEELLKSQNAYELLRSQELSKGVFNSKQMAEEQYNRQVESKKRQMLAYRQTYEDVKQKHSDMFNKLNELQGELDQKVETNRKIEEAIQKFNEIENSENANDIKTLRGLVALNESLKKQQEEFKLNCKKQLQDYKIKIENLQKGENELSGEEGERIKLIEETYNRDSEKLKQIKSLLAKKNRTILLLERKLDDIPSRTELTQYQREFVELFEQVAAKLVETRQYYNTYNTLEDQRVFLNKELSILDSINEKYNLAMASKTNRENLLKSMQQIIEQVEKNSVKTKEKLENEQNTRDVLKKKHVDLIEKQGYYVKCTKEFETECRKNVILQQKLEESKNKTSN